MRQRCWQGGRVAKLSSDRLDKFKPQARNANKHTQRGMGTLETSMRKYGYVAPMTAAADGEIIDGSARIETSANVFGDDVIVVHHDGTKPVIMVRDDIPSADTPEARAISIAANRVAELNLDFDGAQIALDVADGLDLSAFWFDWEIDKLTGEAQEGEFDAAAEWKGMPEFEQPDTMPHRSVIVHFLDDGAVQDFARIIGQDLTDKTKYVWHPEQKPQKRLDVQYVTDES